MTKKFCLLITAALIISMAFPASITSASAGPCSACGSIHTYVYTTEVMDGPTPDYCLRTKVLEYRECANCMHSEYLRTRNDYEWHSFAVGKIWVILAVNTHGEGPVLVVPLST